MFTHTCTLMCARTQENSPFHFFSFSAHTKTFCSRNVFIRTLGSHRSHPAKREKSTFISLLRASLCVFRHLLVICVHIMIHLERKPTVTTTCRGVECQWLTRQPSFQSRGAIRIAQGHSFLRSDLVIQIPTQCFNWFSSDLERAREAKLALFRGHQYKRLCYADRM